MHEINELYTIRDFLRLAVSHFNQSMLYYGHGTDSAWDEAVALILHALYLPADINPAILDARLTNPEKSKIFQLIKRRIDERIPVPYLTQEAWFAGLPFFVDERVLIPRSPMAELIENQFQPWIDPDRVSNALDLCTGSGCIAIAMAKAFPEATIDASDISTDAISVAKINVLRHHVVDQVHLYEGDLFQALPNKKYDIIISNPPYVDAVDMENLPKEYKHEPQLGLKAGVDGLEVVIKILQQASLYLNEHGILVVEVGNSEQAVIEKFPDVDFTWLEFERGGDGVFLLTKDQLDAFKNLFKQASAL